MSPRAVVGGSWDRGRHVSWRVFGCTGAQACEARRSAPLSACGVVKNHRLSGTIITLTTLSYATDGFGAELLLRHVLRLSHKVTSQAYLLCGLLQPGHHMRASVQTGFAERRLIGQVSATDLCIDCATEKGMIISELSTISGERLGGSMKRTIIRPLTSAP